METGWREKRICGLWDKGMFSLKGRIKQEYTTGKIKSSKGERKRGTWGRSYGDNNIWMEFYEGGSLLAE